MTTPAWSTACPDWEARIVEKRSLIPFEPLFPEEAQKALDIFTSLKAVDVGGAPALGAISRQWTLDFVAAIFGSYDADAGRRLITEYLELVSKKNGKALALNTPIPTPSGWTTMGEIEPGDWVLGANGRPCRVTATSPVFHDHTCYRVSFSNGEMVTADAGHLWETSTIAGKPSVKTTQQIVDTLYRGYDGARNHSIRMSEPVELPDVALPIAPYTLGAWLGDGTSECAIMTCADEEIMQSIEADGYPLGRRRQKPDSKAWTQAIGVLDRSGVCSRGHVRRSLGATCLECERMHDTARRRGAAPDPITRFALGTTLRAWHLLGNKHIPDIYLRASKAQRLALLQGLMDTDGTISKAGTAISFTNCNEAIVRGIVEILASFGVKCTVTPRPMTCNGRPVPGYAWLVQFMAFRDELPVFRLSRKLARMRCRDAERNAPRSRTVQITKAVEVPSVPVKCIVVDSPDHLFLFGRTMLPTHNSSQAAGIMLTALLLNWRHEAEFLILSPTVEIANNSFGPAAAMVRADSELSAMLSVQDHVRTITHRVTRATLKVIAAENDTVGGKKATGILVDELWLFGKRADAENMLREATGGIASRPEGFVIYLTTQSDAPPAGVFKQKLDYARDVRDGKIVDPQMLPVLYEFPRWMIEKKLERLPENFYVTNPNLGASVDNAYLVRELGKAIAAGEHSLRGFLAKHLNVEIGMNLRADRWAGAEFWLQAVDPTLCDIDEVLARSDVVCVGIDGGGLDDLLGLAVLGRDEKTGEWLLWVHAWAHPIVLERQQAEAARLQDFATQGDLTLVERIGQDVEGVVEIVQQCEASGKLDKVGVDPVGIGAIVDALEEIGITIEEKRIVAVSQGWKLNGAIKTTERRIAEGAMKHAGRPMMDWCAGNAKVEPRGNAITVTKQASGTAKIDPLMATFNAVSLMSLAPQSKVMPAGYSLLSV